MNKAYNFDSIFMASSIGTKAINASFCLVLYVLTCRILRFRCLKKIEDKYGLETRQQPTYAGMTDQQAYEIQQEISEAEFPALFEKGLQFALFRTYGIPSISRTLQQTAQLGTTENVAKRYADTAAIIVEIYSNPPSGERGIEAFARINYLHNHYIKQGKIKNEDMLYTLALFMTQPCEWINRYEWRSLTDLEICAVAVFHKSMGDAMEISYEPLPGYEAGWRDGLHFYAELFKWSEEYEARNMVPDENNHKIAKKTRELLLNTVPAFTHPLVTQLISAAMDERLRKAVKFNQAAPIIHQCLEVFMSTRRFVLRYLALPRFKRNKMLSTEVGKDGQRWVSIWSTTPHYVKPTLWNRFGPSGWYQLLLGAPRPGDPGMCPEGFLRSNLGPRAFDGKGKADFVAQKERLTKSRTGGCPFH